MAQKVQVTLVCDLCSDGKPGSDTVSFGFDGASYEIDLCEKHSKGMRDAMATYVGSARRAPGAAGGRRRRAGASTGPDRQRTQEIRAWARKKGLKVSERGRISAQIVSQYEAAKNK